MELSNFDSLPSQLQNSAVNYTFERGQRLFRQDDRATNFYLITSGRVKLVRYTIEGKMVVLQVVGRGESLGEDTFISDVYPYSAIADTETRAIAYSQSLLTQIVRDYPELADDLIAKLITKIQSLEIGLELLQIRSAHLRLLQYLQYKAVANVVNLDRPLKDIAAELNLAPRTLSRALAILEDEARITRQEDSIILQIT